MNKFFKRIGAILLALTLCFGTTLTAFAAEDESSNNLPSEESIISVASSDGPKTFSYSTTLYVKVDTEKKDALIYICIQNNPTAIYQITVVDPNGNTIKSLQKAGDNDATPFSHDVIPGTYTFKILNINSNFNSATASAIIA